MEEGLRRSDQFSVSVFSLKINQFNHPYQNPGSHESGFSVIGSLSSLNIFIIHNLIVANSLLNFA